MSPKQEATLSKIEALLAKADSSEHDAEAQTYREKAYELMARYGIEQVELAAKRRKQKQKAEEIIEKVYDLKGRDYNKQERTLAHNIITGVGTLKMLRLSIGAKLERIYVFGYESDVAAFDLMFASLRLQMNTAMRAWWKAEGLELHKGKAPYRQKVERREFLDSFSWTVGRRLREEREKAEKQHDTTANLSEGSTALALRSRGDDADAFMRKLYTVGTGRRSTAMGGSSSSSAAGGAAGQRASLGNSSKVSTGRAGALTR